MSNLPEHPDEPFDDDLSDDPLNHDEPDRPDTLPSSGAGSLAPIWARAIARAIDMVIVFSASSIILNYTGVVEVVDDEVVASNSWAVILVLVAVWCFYEVGGTVAQTRMVGKLLMGLRVRGVDQDRAPRPAKVFMRWLVPAVVVLIPLGGLEFAVVATIYLSALLMPRLQGFHDRIANTLVVRAR